MKYSYDLHDLCNTDWDDCWSQAILSGFKYIKNQSNIFFTYIKFPTGYYQKTKKGFKKRLVTYQNLFEEKNKK